MGDTTVLLGTDFVPIVNDESTGFSIACCKNCGFLISSDRKVCPKCLGFEFTEVPGSEVASVQSFVWYWQRLDPRSPQPPYNVVIARLSEGIDVLSTVKNVKPGELSVGDELRAVVEKDDLGHYLVFVPR